LATIGLAKGLRPSVCAQTDTNVYHMVLAGRGVLKDVFDAGLRPRRPANPEPIHCQIEDKIIDFDLGGGRSATIPAEACYLKVCGTRQVLREITAQSIPLALAETRAWMAPICRHFARPVEELDAFLQKVRNGHKRFGWLGGEDENEGFGVGTPRPAGQSGLACIAVSLQHYGADTNRPVRILVAVTWERTWQEMRESPGLLRLPEGYEQFSMEPLETGPPFTASWIRKGEPPPASVLRELGPMGVQRLRDDYVTRMGLATPPVPFHPPAPGLNQ
jgi:hypothetical protein